MQHFPFGEIIKDSWKITLRHKKLWWFGLFISGGGFAFQIPDFTKLDNKNLSISGLGGLVHNLFTNISILLGIAVVIVLLGVVVWGLSLICRAAILQGLVKVKNGDSYKFWTLFSSGTKKIWRLLWLQIIVSIPACVLIILGLCSVPWSNFAVAGIRWWLLLPAIALFLCYGIFTALFEPYAYCYAVIEDQPAWRAIKSGFGLMKKNLGNVMVVALIYVGLSMASMMGVFVAIFCLAIPFVLLGLLAIFISSWLMIGVIFLAAICLFAVIIILRGAIGIYFQSYFANAYWELKK